MLLFLGLYLDQGQMYDFSAVVIILASPFWNCMYEDSFLEGLEKLGKYDFFQIFLGVLSWSIPYGLKSSIPERLLQDILNAVDKVDLPLDMFTPLLEYETFPCHVVVLIDTLHYQLYDILVLGANHSLLIGFRIDGNS